MPDYIQRWRKGPYGTNEGDMWSVEESTVGQQIKTEHGGIMIHEMLRVDGKVEERIYWVPENSPDSEIQDLIREARAGTRLLIDAQAQNN